MNKRWAAEQIPDQQGRTAIVTGANSGLGFVVARELARAGARVIIASRDAGRRATAIGGVVDEEVKPVAVAQKLLREGLDRSEIGEVELFPLFMQPRLPTCPAALMSARTARERCAGIRRLHSPAKGQRTLGLPNGSGKSPRS